MTSDDPRDELAQIAASLRAYLEWQSDSGAWGIPRAPRRAAPLAVVAAADDAGHEADPAHGHEPAYAEPRFDAPPDAPPPVAPPAPSASFSRVPVPPPARALGAPTNEELDAMFRDVSRRTAPAPAPLPTAQTVAVSGARLPAVDPSVERARRLPMIAREVSGCVKCDLAKTRTNTVFSRGNPAAQLVFVGEAPGADEDAQGLPFVGRAGQLLDKMIAAMGLSPEKDVYVSNIIKCRPPDNRPPTPVETETCIPYLHEQLALVQPKVIVALGNTAVAGLLGTRVGGITKIRGAWKLYRGTTLVMPTYHPSYLLRASPQQAEAKRQAWEDLQTVMRELGLAVPPPRPAKPR